MCHGATVLTLSPYLFLFTSICCSVLSTLMHSFSSVSMRSLVCCTSLATHSRAIVTQPRGTRGPQGHPSTPQVQTHRGRRSAALPQQPHGNCKASSLGQETSALASLVRLRPLHEKQLWPVEDIHQDGQLSLHQRFQAVLQGINDVLQVTAHTFSSTHTKETQIRDRLAQPMSSRCLAVETRCAANLRHHHVLGPIPAASL